jgi:hypothetical protein
MDHLLRQAAKCYVEAQWADDACRVFEQVGNFARAAYYHEKQSRWARAAHFYALAGQWRSAARCYLLCDSPVEAADCLLRVNQPLNAAWYLSHLAHHFVRAESVARTVIPASRAEKLGIDLVVARCQAGTGAHGRAARELRSIVEQFGELLTMPHLIEWALAVAEALRRPDLTALVYAAAVNSGVPDASEKWQQWSAQMLGSKIILPAHEPEERVNNRWEILDRRPA